MTGLAERANQLQEMVVLSLRREKLLVELQTLQARVTQLRGWDERLHTIAPAARALKSAGTPAEVLKDIDPLKRSASQALKDFRADPQSVRRPNITAVNVFWGQASQRIETISAEMRSEWDRYVTHSMPEVQPDVVRALAGRDAEAIVSRLVDLDRQARALASHLPADDEEAAEVIEIAREVQSVVEEFDLRSMPEEVQRFVEAALGEQATLDLLTPDVRDWLRERGIEDNVRLGFAPTR